MKRSRVQRWATLLLAVALLAVVPISASAQTQADVDRAERERQIAETSKSQAFKEYEQIAIELTDAVNRYEVLWAERSVITHRMNLMEEAVTMYRSDAINLENRARDIVIDAYISGQRNLVGAAFTAHTIQDLVTSQALRERAAERDLTSLDNLDAVTRQVERGVADLEIQRIEVTKNHDAAEIVVNEMAELHEERAAILARADASLHAAIDKFNSEVREKRVEDDRIKRQKAQRSAARPGAAGGAPPEATPGFRCPVQGGASFIDSWGFPRSGGRTHRGVDMFNARHTPVVAVVDGRVRLSYNRIGGLSTHLHADNGTIYYYTHLEGHPSNITSGQRVSRGTVVGFLGNSGNARYTSPHLHFEIRPNGRAVNPYPTVRASC